MTQYSIEVYDRTLNLKRRFEVGAVCPALDYLTHGPTKIQLTETYEANKGDFVFIRKNYKIIFYGVLKDFESDEYTTTLSVMPFFGLVDQNHMCDVSISRNEGIEAFLRRYLNEVFNGPDPYENLPGFDFISSTTTPMYIASTDNSLYNLFEILVDAFEQAGLMVHFDVDLMEKSIKCSTHIVSDKVIGLDVSVSDVSELKVTKANNSDKANVCTYYNKDDMSQTLTYYWHPNGNSGTVDTSPAEPRESLVKHSTSVITLQEGNTFESQSYADAYSAMYKNRYSDKIEFLIKNDSKIIDVSALNIGDVFLLKNEQETTQTILSAKTQVNDSQTRLTFGMLRPNLTDKLKKKWR